MSHPKCRQNSLFDSPDGPEPSSSTRPSTALVISGQALGPGQKLFNQLLAQIDKRKQALQDLVHLMGEHRIQYARLISPLEQKRWALQRQMALFLDQRLQNSKGLSKKIRAGMAEMIAGLAGGLMNDPDGADMRALYERYAPPDMPDGDAEAAAIMQSMMSEVFGVELEDGEQHDTPEQVMAAAMRKMHEKHEQQASQEAARKARRKKTPKQMRAEQESLDADKVLRDIYRKLASALHPDRETNGQERLRKTALMVEVNVANEKKDLLALLQLQLKVEQIDPASVSAMAEDKLRHFNRVLKEQAQCLQMELEHAQFMFRSEFDLPYSAITPRSLEMALRQTAHELEQTIRMMQRDLDLIQDDRELKVWIREQQAASDDSDEFDMLGLAAFGAALSKFR
jgi:hypothetical protein